MAFKSQDIGESIVYLPDHNMLYCTKYQSAIPFLELKNHLRLNSDHKLSPAKWRPVFKAAQTMSSLLNTTLAELPIPRHDTEPLPFLPILEGMRCRECDCLRGTRKDDGFWRAHVDKSHKKCSGQKWQDFVEEVEVQRWVADTRGTYCVVGSSGMCEPRFSSESPTSYEQVLEALEAEEDIELEEVAKQNQQEDDAKGLDKSTPWLKHHTKWPTRFKGKPH